MTTFVTQKAILDRIHTINENELATVKASRYFTPDVFVNTAAHPMIVPYVQRRDLNNRSSGAGVRFVTYTIEQLCVVGKSLKGLPGESMSILMESIMDEVEDVYSALPRLAYNGGDLVHGAQFNGATVPRPDPERALMIILFSHTVTTSQRKTGA